MIEVKLKNDNTLRLDLERPDLTDRFVEHYNQGHSALWECPWCGGDIDAVCDERNDETFEDTWHCVGDCELLITFITPAEYTEYHEVMDGEWTILIEGSFSGEWLTPEEWKDHD